MRGEVTFPQGWGNILTCALAGDEGGGDKLTSRAGRTKGLVTPETPSASTLLPCLRSWLSSVFLDERYTALTLFEVLVLLAELCVSG